MLRRRKEKEQWQRWLGLLLSMIFFLGQAFLRKFNEIYASELHIMERCLCDDKVNFELLGIGIKICCYPLVSYET